MICEQEIESFVLSLPGELGHIKKIVEPLLHVSGFELVWMSASKNNLNFFVDRTGEASITVDDLGEVSRLLGDVLDVESAEVSLLSKEYNLEVSSPGLDRPLSKKSHFSQAIDQQVQIKCAPGTIVGLSRLAGKLIAVGDDGVSVLSLEGKEHKIAWGSINSAHKIWSPTRASKPRTKK